MDIAIIIVNWNTRDILGQCLQSVFASQTAKQFEVWVVDNGSSDGSKQMIKDSYPRTRLISNCDNVGFARANNQAVELSSGDYVMLLNPDTMVEKDVIEILANYLDENPEIGAVGPRLLNPDGTLQESAYPEPTLVREFWRMFHLDRFYYYAEYPMDSWSEKEAKEVDVLMGACLLIRRKALDQVGLLDEEFFVYSEEVDLCTRIRNYGWRISWLPKIQYFRKHHSAMEVWLYKFVLFLATLVRIVLTPFAYLERSAQKSKHLELSSNYRRLLLSLPNF